jgi:hypothetical protein
MQPAAIVHLHKEVRQPFDHVIHCLVLVCIDLLMLEGLEETLRIGVVR